MRQVVAFPDDVVCRGKTSRRQRCQSRNPEKALQDK